MEKRTTRISRSWNVTAGYLGGAVVALGVSVLLFTAIVEGPATPGIALIPAGVALILLRRSLGSAGRAACPNCGAQLRGLSTTSNVAVLCPTCRRYSEGEDGLLWQTDENRIADEPVFGSPLPERFALPKGCCVCGGLEAGRERISLQPQDDSSAVTVPTVGVTTEATVSVEVPYCWKHLGGAQLTGAPQRPYIRFRSYSYLRAFCRLNGTTPG